MHAIVIAAFLAAQSPQSDTLAKVQATYRAAGDISGRFEQTYVDKIRGKKKTERGELWAKKDGRVRWSYNEPARKDFVFTGEAAYFYEPENAQVTVFERFQDSPVANAMRFLWGQGELAQTFDVAACDATCIAEPGSISLKLVPKEPLGSVDRIQLDADPQSHRVKRSIVFDTLGNRTEYVFKDMSFTAQVADKKFAFSIPPGVSVLRAAAEEAQAKDGKPQPTKASPQTGSKVPIAPPKK